MRQTLTLRSSLCSLLQHYCSMAAATASSSLLRSGTADPSFKLDKKLIHSFFDSPYNGTNFTRRMSIKVCSDNRDRLIERTEQKNINHRHYRRSHNLIDSLNSSAYAVDSDIGTNAGDAARLANGHGGACHRGSTEVQSNHKIVVAVDVDEVLGNFVSALNRFIADRYSSDHSVSEYHVYEFFRIWNCTRDEADLRVHEFFKTPYFKKGIHPIPGALQALQKVSSFCNLSVVTSRQNAIREHTVQWIEKHYPGLFQDIHFGNHFALEGQSRPKSDICRSLGAKVLIDDNPRYAMECAEVGIRVLLFDYKNSYPWCKLESVDQHPLVTKVHTWDEVEHRLISWMFNQSFTLH